MLSVNLYRKLLRLYPEFHRAQFAKEMLAVYSDMRSEAVAKGSRPRSAFYIRETAGVLSGALQEHWRALGCDPVWFLLPVRRLTMRSQFRFPKMTPVLMMIILAGVVSAIQRGEAISYYFPNVSKTTAPLGPLHSNLLPGVVLGLAIFYIAGMLGWVILFAMRRSGVHRLDGTLSQPK
jgi:hypothetical protein